MPWQQAVALTVFTIVVVAATVFGCGHMARAEHLSRRVASLNADLQAAERTGAERHGRVMLVITTLVDRLAKLEAHARASEGRDDRPADLAEARTDQDKQVVHLTKVPATPLKREPAPSIDRPVLTLECLKSMMAGVPLAAGEARRFRRCRTCGQVMVLDFIPFGLGAGRQYNPCRCCLTRNDRAGYDVLDTAEGPSPAGDDRTGTP